MPQPDDGTKGEADTDSDEQEGLHPDRDRPPPSVIVADRLWAVILFFNHWGWLADSTWTG